MKKLQGERTQITWKARLCLAVNIAHRDSALMVLWLLSSLKNDSTDREDAIAFPASLCFLVLM